MRGLEFTTISETEVGIVQRKQGGVMHIRDIGVAKNELGFLD